MIDAMIEVLVVEPDPLWRALIARALGRAGELDVWPPVDGTASAFRRMDHGVPQIAVVAAQCTDVCTRLVDEGVGVVLLYAADDPASAADAVRRGARGCVAKASSADDLAATVLTVASGGTAYACAQ